MNNRRSAIGRTFVAGLASLLVLASVPAVFGQSAEPQPVRIMEHEQTGTGEFQVRVSGRTAMISGGDALIEIDVPPGVPLDRTTVSLNGQDVTHLFEPASGTRSLLGLLTDLRPGDNLVTVAEEDGAEGNSLALTNWPIEGPIFSGPHEAPYVCMTHLFELPVTGGTLGPALDENCSIATRVDYIYRTTGDEFRALADPSTRPADLAHTTTNDGRDVAYIVRVETGTVNRAIYRFSVLHDPMADPEPGPLNRPAGWNGRLIYTFGGGCPGGWYIQGARTGGVLDPHMLSQGFAVASSSKNVYGNNCDDVLSAETLMMVKERFSERYGAPAHTIGWGSSGGAHQVHLISHNYPGLLDGVIAASSFPDVPTASVNMQGFGTRLLYHYFTETSEEQWTREQQVAVAGLPSYETLETQATRGDRLNPRGVCDPAVPAELYYDPVTNPRGARCTPYDHQVSSYGRDPSTGFARRPLDNVGVQYGLDALNDDTIGKDQFLDLNERIGGIDIDTNFTAERTVADSIAIRRAYEYGRILSGGGGLASTPIIDYRAYSDDRPGDVHMRFHSFSTRERLKQVNGHANNHVMLHEDYSYGGFSTSSPLNREALGQMDLWLLNLAKDASDAPRAEKVVHAKPTDLVDSCLAPGGERIRETQLYREGACDGHFPSHASPYLVAGMPVANNIVKCQLKEVDPSDYTVRFTSTEMERLRGIFPDGVCDYTRPGVEQRPVAGTWLSFGPAGAGTEGAP